MRTFRFSCLVFSTVMSCTVSSVFSQALQLPSYENFGASTTVNIPDGGSMNTAGVTRSSSGGKSSGTPILPFRNRSYGSSMGTSMMQTSVQIIDLEEMDREILNSPSGGSGYSSGGAGRSLSPLSPAGISRRVPLRPEDRFQARKEAEAVRNGGGFMSTQEAIQARIGKETKKRDSGNDLNTDLVLVPARTPVVSQAETNIETDLEREKQALSLARKGYKAEKAGEVERAVKYYQRASELAEGELLRKIQKRLRAVSLSD